jgi:septum formation topological specificity factor MinE
MSTGTIRIKDLNSILGVMRGGPDQSIDQALSSPEFDSILDRERKKEVHSIFRIIKSYLKSHFDGKETQSVLWLDPKTVEKLLENLIKLRRLTTQHQDSILYRIAIQYLLMILIYKDKSTFGKYTEKLDPLIIDVLNKYVNADKKVMEKDMETITVGKVSGVIYQLIEADKKFEN